MKDRGGIDRFLVEPNAKISLAKDFDPGRRIVSEDKRAAEAELHESIQRLAEYQDKLYAQNTFALLVILQALDAAGKDGVIKHVMSGLNPQGCEVYSFKAPSDEERDHDYLWRCMRALPQRGRIGIFNRSYYEEVLVVRVHPGILAAQQLPTEVKTDKKIWKQRFDQINNFERYLVENGILVVKLFLYVSKQEQRKRFLARIEEPEKNWKFSAADVVERQHYEEYIRAYEDCLAHTSTKWAPWYVLPADHKPSTRLAVARVLEEKLKSLNLQYPEIDDAARAELGKAREMLEAEDE